MLQRCHLRNSNFALITFRHDINLHGTTYTEAQIHRKAPHLVRLETNFLRILQEFQINYY